MELEEYKFDHFKNIDEVMHYFNYWYKEEDVYSINRYLSLKDFNYISNKYQELQKENKQLKEQLLVTQTNEETFRLEMKDITQTLGLDENTIFDDVKVYARSLKDNWNELKKYIQDICCYDEVGLRIIDPSYLEDKIAELERGVSNE